jgi:hypothetical protein
LIAATEFDRLPGRDILQGALDLLVQSIEPREEFVLPRVDRGEAVADCGGCRHGDCSNELEIDPFSAI